MKTTLLMAMAILAMSCSKKATGVGFYYNDKDGIMKPIGNGYYIISDDTLVVSTDITWDGISGGSSECSADSVPEKDSLPIITELPGWGNIHEIKYWTPGDVHGLPVDLEFYLEESNNQKAEWKEIVTVLYEGDQNCAHDYINSSPMQKGVGMACAVLHTGPCGCDWNWPHFRRICKKCLRHEDVRKECSSIFLSKTMDYNDYLNVLNEKH